jgi:hypothetical protein
MVLSVSRKEEEKKKKVVGRAGGMRKGEADRVGEGDKGAVGNWG